MFKAEIGTWIEQKNTESIALVIDELKKGGMKVLMHDWRGRVVMSTTTNWYPEPTHIDVNDVPQKVRDKVERYIERQSRR